MQHCREVNLLVGYIVPDSLWHCILGTTEVIHVTGDDYTKWLPTLIMNSVPNPPFKSMRHMKGNRPDLWKELEYPFVYYSDELGFKNGKPLVNIYMGFPTRSEALKDCLKQD